MREFLTEDKVRDKARTILNFTTNDKADSDVGQLTTFKQLGFNSNKKPDGWYLPKNKIDVAIILETKNSGEDLNKQCWIDEIKDNCNIIRNEYDKTIGILYNGYDVKVFKNNNPVNNLSDELQDKYYYIRLFTEQSIDKEKIYLLTAKINNCLHSDFGIKNLYHRMIFTACALVAARYGAVLVKGMDYSTFHQAILSQLNKSLQEDKRQNHKLGLLTEVYSEIKMNTTENQEAINNFISWIKEISELITSDHWNGEDVMGIFFNEFNRYKKKSESGQVFTPDHITSLMYRLLDINQNDYVLDAACGSGAFLVKSMANMMKQAGGYDTAKAKEIRRNHLFGIEFDREIYALACANMLIHKDGKTNLEQLDSRTQTACSWIQSKPITKVLMNPPFENKYGCVNIVQNVLDSVPIHTKCAFILPDKKLEKVSKKLVNEILNKHQIQKIIKLSEKTFNEGVTTSIFIFESGVPQNNKQIFACYIAEDGLETVKNQGRHDIKNKWPSIEDYWVDIIHKQSGNETIQWIKPDEHLSYQLPEKEFEIYEEDFNKTVLDYMMFKEGIDVKKLREDIADNNLYFGDDNEEN